MIRQLRNKYILINFLLMFFVFICIIFLIYISARMQAYKTANFKLTISMSAEIEFLKKDPQHPVAIAAIVDETNPSVVDWLIVDSALGQQMIDRILAKAVKLQRESAAITVDSHSFMFVKHRMPPDEHKLRILFTDITYAEKSLHSLLLILIAISGLSSIILLGVSFYISQRSIRPIEEMFEREQKFISDISHNLKTPIAVISTNLAVISMHEQETIKNQSKWIGYIHSQLNKMSSIVNDLLTIARMESLDVQLNLQEVQLSKLLEASLLYMEERFFSSNITVNPDIDQHIYVTADKSDISQLIDLLLDNAAKYTPHNGEITVMLKAGHYSNTLSISNTTEGITEAHLPFLFERFYQVNTASDGSGLGLSIAHSIVQRYKGRIYAQIIDDNEIVFTVELPVDNP